MNLKETIELLNFDYVNEDITEENFPKEKIRGKLVAKHFDKDITSDEVIAEAKGLKPANLYELLKYAKKWNGVDTIVALGSSTVVDGSRHVPYLSGWDDERHLSLGLYDDGWFDSCRFLFVGKLDGKLDTGTLCPCQPLDTWKFCPMCGKELTH